MDRCKRLSVGNKPRIRSLGAIGGVAVIARLLVGCTGDSGTPLEPADAASSDDSASDAPRDARDSGLDADASRDATPDRAETGTEAAASDGPLPDGVPDGWETWAGWEPQCPLYVPGEHGQLPPPVEWEPCPDPVPSHLVCQQMKDTWAGNGIARPSFALDATGRPLLQFTRMYLNGNDNHALMAVAEADGPVRSALLQLDLQNKDCGYWPEAVTSTRYVISPTMWQHLSDGGRVVEHGAISGRLTPLAPDLMLRLDTDRWSMAWYASDSLLVGLRLGRHDAWPWDFSQTHAVYSSGNDPDGLPPIQAIVAGGDVFSRVTGGGRCGVNSWNVEHGSRPLLRWYGDSTRGAGNFGTDGTDMVWTYSEGTNACKNDPPNPEVWTAPYTTDPAVVAATAHRLRKDVRGMSPESYAVGFGYAMRSDYFGDPMTGGLFVVRLSDGVGWKIPGTSDYTVQWADVLGFTETELFVEVYMPNSVGPMLTIMRIRLDSLGPGIPPD